ncbi:MAG: type II toxin-antitoxin system prevent-host-death family antitoxin [Gammaproteobacteria bacterium]|nr:type II toxin-antitoxin system prevent-host-death family antitoxin [Gammaproteobacteria bacterium]
MEHIITVNIATLKTHFSKYLRTVRAGEEVIVLDHKMPVAKIVQIEEIQTLASTKPRGSFAKTITTLKIPPALKQRGIHSLALLLEERGAR